MISSRTLVPLLASLLATACAVEPSSEGDPSDAPEIATAQSLTIVPTRAVRASKVSVGRAHACALLDDGTAACWGENGKGQLGRGTTGADAVYAGAVSPSALGLVREISAGADHTCATRTADGTVACWGVNDAGEVGSLPLDFPLYFPTPITVRGLASARSLSSATDHSCAIMGVTVYCWGTREGNRLGDGATSGATHEPVDVMTTPFGVAAGDRFSCARTSNGVTCWGRRFAPANAFFPQAWTTQTQPWSFYFNGVRSIAIGNRHACVADSMGNVHCWGESSYGQTGVGGDGTGSPVRVMAGVTGVVELSAGDEHTCARLENGTVKCWGRNAYGQLGNGTTTAWLPPVTVQGLSGVTALGAGGATSCAVASGVVKCWGANASGQLGDGTTTRRTTPVYAMWPALVATP